MKIITRISIIIFLITVAFNIKAQQGKLHIINPFHIGGSGKWDYIQVGPVNDWLYVSHGTQVNVLNKKTGDSITIIPNTIGVHGIAFDSALGKGFISNGKLNTVTVFDMHTNKVLSQINTSNDPDAIFYEPFSKKIITSNGHTKYINIIDPVLDRVIDSVDVGGSPEVAVSDGKGKLFVNIEDKNELVAIDLKTFEVLYHWSLANNEGPTGLAIDKESKRLFVGCEKKLVIIDAINGKIIDTLPIGNGCDGTAFDATTKNVYASCGNGTLSVIHEVSANKFIVIENFVTKKGARTLALDNYTHTIYLPTAEYEIAQPNQTGRPKAKEGTFQILVVGNNQ